jgi:uncharacterized cupin superfamily protein
MSIKPPALDPATLVARSTCSYPEPFRSRVMPREKRALGDALGLSHIGINLTTLFPGKESSVLHFHSHEDEFIFILEGEVVLRTPEGEQLLTPGTCAAFPAGSKQSAHQLSNRSDRPARYLEVSNRHPEDCPEYVDADLVCHKGANGITFTKRDGSSY